MKTLTLKRLTLAALTAGIFFACGSLLETSAQRDPFVKPSFMRVRKQVSSSPGKGTSANATPVNYGPPAIEARIEYFKRLRESAAAAGEPLPKVTSVLTLNEMSVTGIFKTPRGYAAMVEATPIKLSYTIYPGEKFFDGQLVAVEENRLVFRRVNKIGPGKFVASVENKPLKQYSTKAQIEGTAPTQATERPMAPTTAAASPEPPPADTKAAKQPTNPFLSPLDEMNSQPEQPTESGKEKPKKPVKKPAKVAKK